MNSQTALAVVAGTVIISLIALVNPAWPLKHCTARGVLPDPSCTPGAVNQHVTQANIQSTICKTGWTSTVRPPVSFTAPLKRKQMRQYGFTDSPSNYEEDHLIPLELGGSPTSEKNLWPEPGASPNKKDSVESTLRARVCKGQLSLKEAQRRIAADWTAAL